jgi:ABC-type oligopeptide transport system ATPase subunit
MDNKEVKAKIVHVAGFPGSGKTTLAELYKNLHKKNVFVLDLDDLTVKIINKSKLKDDPKSMIDSFIEKYNSIMDGYINKVKLILIVGIVNNFHSKSYTVFDYDLEKTNYPPDDKIFINISLSKLANQIHQRTCGYSHKLTKKGYMLKHYRNFVAGGNVNGEILTDYNYSLIKSVKADIDFDRKYYVVDRKYVPMKQMEIIDYINNKYLFLNTQKMDLPRIIEIFMNFNLDLSWFLYYYLEYKFPDRKIYDAYNTIYHGIIEGKTDIYPKDKCVILSPPLILCNTSECKLIPNKFQPTKDYVAVVITQPGSRKIDVCAEDEKKISKMFYENEFIIKTRANPSLVSDLKGTTESPNAKFGFENVSELIFYLSITLAPNQAHYT